MYCSSECVNMLCSLLYFMLINGKYIATQNCFIDIGGQKCFFSSMVSMCKRESESFDNHILFCPNVFKLW